MSEDYKRGQRDGIRWAITWLHQRAREMNDPNAKTVLNTAAFHIGVEAKEVEILASAPVSSEEAPSGRHGLAASWKKQGETNQLGRHKVSIALLAEHIFSFRGRSMSYQAIEDDPMLIIHEAIAALTEFEELKRFKASAQLQTPSGHQDFEAKAKEIAVRCRRDLQGFGWDWAETLIASALSEAYEAGRGLFQITAEPATELSGHQNAEIAKLRGLLYSAQFALHAFTLVDEIPFDLDDQAKVEITITELSADSGPEFDVHTVAIRIGTDIMNARRIVEALEAQVTAPKSQGEFETKSIIDHPYYNPRTPDDER